MENSQCTIHNYGYFSAKAEKFRVDLFLKRHSYFIKKSIKELSLIKAKFNLNCEL